MSKADELLRRSLRITDEVGDAMQLVIVLPNGDSAWMGCYEPDSIAANVLLALRAYLNEKPHEPPPHLAESAMTLLGPGALPPEASPPHAAAEPPRIRVGEFNVECTACGMHWSRWDSAESHDADCPNAPPAAAEPEQPVAWMYEKNGKLSSATRNRWAYKGEWTEIPLYASPSAQPIAREPTEEMIEAGRHAPWEQGDPRSAIVELTWRAMYDAALKSAGKEST